MRRSCRAPHKLAYYAVAGGVACEAMALVLTLAAGVIALGFPMLRAASGLAFASAVIGVSASSGYACCCVRARRRALVVLLVCGSGLAVGAMVLAARNKNETPCVRRDCYYDACRKCSSRDCNGRSYMCTHLYWLYEECPRARWCSTWDVDCSKGGSADDAVFLGYETRDDCEKANDVRDLRTAARNILVVALTATLLVRFLTILAVLFIPLVAVEAVETGPPLARSHPIPVVEVFANTSSVDEAPMSGDDDPLPRAEAQPSPQRATKV